MARIFHDGFELGRPIHAGSTASGSWDNSMWQVYRSHTSGITVGVSSASASGSYGFVLSSTALSNRSGSIRRNLGTTLVEHYGRCMVRAPDVSGTYTQAIFFLSEGGDKIASIYMRENVDTLVDVALYIGSSQVAALTSAFARNIWMRIEWRLLFDTVSGVFELKRNGDTVLSYEGNTGGNGVRTIGLGRDYGITRVV